MIFNGIGKQRVTFYLTGIDHEPLMTDYRDVWLKIWVSVYAFMGTWEAQDTSLTLKDVRRLIRWLEDLADPAVEAATSLYFTEPNLSFTHFNTRKTGKSIRIDFNLELRPDDADPLVQYFITCRLTDAELAEMAADLTFDLEQMFQREDEKLMLTIEKSVMAEEEAIDA